MMFGSSLPPGVCRRARVLFYDNGYVPLVVNTFRSFPHSRLISGFLTRLTRRVPLVEQELLTLPEHLSTHFLLAIVLFVLLRYTDSCYPFGIFKLFLRYLCLFAHSSVQHILCCVLVLLVFIFCLVCPMLSASLDCLFSNVYLERTKDYTLFSIFHLCSCLLVTV